VVEKAMKKVENLLRSVTTVPRSGGMLLIKDALLLEHIDTGAWCIYYAGNIKETDGIYKIMVLAVKATETLSQ
jgi:hypothetical protein